jgi:hypothetical protein
LHTLGAIETGWSSRVRPAWAADAGPPGFELALGPLPRPDSANTRRFAWSSIGLNIRVDLKCYGFESEGGEAPPRMPPLSTAVVDVTDVRSGRRSLGGASVLLHLARLACWWRLWIPPCKPTLAEQGFLVRRKAVRKGRTFIHSHPRWVRIFATAGHQGTADDAFAKRKGSSGPLMSGFRPEDGRDDPKLARSGFGVRPVQHERHLRPHPRPTAFGAQTPWVAHRASTPSRSEVMRAPSGMKCNLARCTSAASRSINSSGLMTW